MNRDNSAPKSMDSGPAVALLSNGRYSVLVTAAGAGWGTSRDLDVTRRRGGCHTRLLGAVLLRPRHRRQHVVVNRKAAASPTRKYLRARLSWGPGRFPL